MSSFRIDVADLLRHPGARRTVRLTEPLEDLVGSAAVVTDIVMSDDPEQRTRDWLAATAPWRNLSTAIPPR